MRSTKIRGFKKRSVSGQGLIHGVAALILITTVGVVLALLLFNVGVVFLYQDKVNRIADEAARSINREMYWLGMTNPSFSGNMANLQTQNTNLIKRMLEAAGLASDDQHVRIEYNQDTVSVGTQPEPSSATVTVVTLRVSGLRTVGGLCFPSGVTLKATGTAAQAAGQTYACSVLNFYDPNYSGPAPVDRSIRFPIYEACTVEGSTVTRVIKAGKLHGGNINVAYMPMSNAGITEAKLNIRDYLTAAPPSSNETTHGYLGFPW
jgi:hypothetical protein